MVLSLDSKHALEVLWLDLNANLQMVILVALLLVAIKFQIAVKWENKKPKYHPRQYDKICEMSTMKKVMH